MTLTPADVRTRQFSTTRLRPGYDEEEVDAFLDEVEAELNRLIQENEELRSKLAAVLRGGGQPSSAISSPLSDARPDMMRPEPALPERALSAPVLFEQERETAAALVTRPASRNEDSGGAAARLLSLAQQTADRAIADARYEAGETLKQARGEADDVLRNARRQAEQATHEAKARAADLEQEAQERYRQATGSIAQQREELERRVDDLRAFEREYRGRLKAHLEGQLHALEASAPNGAEPAGGLVFQETGRPGLPPRAAL